MPSSSTLIKRNTDFIKGNMSYKALVNAMRKHGLTATKAIIPIVEALAATKTVVHMEDITDETGQVVKQGFVEQIPDHQVRLKAAQMAIDLLGLRKTEVPELVEVHVAKHNKQTHELVTALGSSDEVELQRVLFKKAPDTHLELPVTNSKKKRVSSTN